VSEPTLSYEEILQIVQLFEMSTEFNELHLKYGDIEIDLRKHGAGSPAATGDMPQAVSARPAPESRNLAAATPVPATPVPAAAQAAPVPPSPAAVAAAIAPGSALVKSPMVGTFYCAAEPGATPFVSVGQRVSADSTVCIIEVMKLMNSVQAGVAGVVSQVLVKDGDAVEFSQVLIVIDPDK
jgi:acetyl-CoA carboxylase biotin carboxyl carrier protein